MWGGWGDGSLLCADVGALVAEAVAIAPLRILF